MGTLLKTAIRMKARTIKRSFERATKCPQVTQTKLLLDILSDNRETEYGKEHTFSKITNTDTFAQTVPVNIFSSLSPYVERMKNGEKNILTADQPFMFNLTSGTTDEPKYIPITPKGMALTAGLSDQWIYRALQDHPSFLNHSIFCISSASVEGQTQSGIPYGSASGIMYENLPRILHNSFVLPFVLSKIKDYALRYYVMTRMAMEKELSFIVTPNPTTLIKIGETGIQHQEMIVRSIHDGKMFNTWPFEICKEDAQILDVISANMKPNRTRACFLQQVIDQDGELVPFACWKQLKLIGCWLGGSVGFQVDKLEKFFGKDVPKRDIGYLASEGSITIPYQDNTPAGILALQNNYYEFIPDIEEKFSNTKTLKCHELEQGQKYKIILTNRNGLYRYNFHDIIEVHGFYNQTPIIAFVRKSDEMLNITGEKLHVNHLIKVFQKMKNEHNMSVFQFKVVPNYEKLRYEILMQIDDAVSEEFLKNTILPFIDGSLSEANVEYAEKRKSERLNQSCVHIMKPSWEENVRKHFIKRGYRDIQHKWRMAGTETSDLDREHIQYTIESKQCSKDFFLE